MKRKYLLLFVLIAMAFISKAQTDTTAKLQDAKNLWASYNSGDPNDTSLFAALYADYGTILGIDSLNAKANQGLGDIFSVYENYWLNQAQSFRLSNPTVYNADLLKSSNYGALAGPYLQRYLRIKGISN